MPTEELHEELDVLPYRAGHALLVPRRHVDDWFVATAAERAALFHSVIEAKKRVELGLALHPLIFKIDQSQRLLRCFQIDESSRASSRIGASSL